MFVSVCVCVFSERVCEVCVFVCVCVCMCVLSVFSERVCVCVCLCVLSGCFYDNKTILYLL